MTSLVFPSLRRTLTDVMEDELYHPQQQQATQQGTTFQAIASQQPQPQHSTTQESQLQFTIPSPIPTHARLFRNPSAMNSEEMLTIPDQHNHNTSSLTNAQSPLSRINSRDLYYDIPEQLNEEEPMSNAFNAYANPNLTTTHDNSIVPAQFIENSTQTTFSYPFSFNVANGNCELDNQPSKLVKFNDDYGLEYFQDAGLDDETYGKFIVFDTSPDMIPEQLEDEDISDDEDGAYYLDHEDIANLTIHDCPSSPLSTSTPQPSMINTSTTNNTSTATITTTTMKPSLHQQQLEQQLNMQQEHTVPEAYNLVQEDNHVHTNPETQGIKGKNYSQHPYEDYEVFSNDEEDLNELGSDIDRMSLDASLSSSSSSDEDDESMDEDELLPSFRPLNNSKSPPLTSCSNTINSSGHRIEKKSRTSSISKSFSGTMEESHQCQLINPVTKKPCLKIFSRPYDLIRHQETLHAPSKKIYRCMVCNQLSGGKAKKSFSRCDALSRHIKIKHGLVGDDVEFAMKYARDNVEFIEYK